MLVVPRDHPTGQRSLSLPLARLAELELLLPAPGTALRAEIDFIVVPAQVVLRPAMELDGVRMIASLAFDGYGPAILPATALPGHLRERFASYRIEGMPRRRVGVAQRRRGLPSAPAKAVINVLGRSCRRCTGHARRASTRPPRRLRGQSLLRRSPGSPHGPDLGTIARAIELPGDLEAVPWI